MNWADLVPALAVLGSMFALMAASSPDRGSSRFCANASTLVGWLGLVGAAGALYFELIDGWSAVAGMAASACLAVAPSYIREDAPRSAGFSTAAAVALMVGLAGFTDLGAVTTEAGSSDGRLLVLHASQWSGLAAAVTSLLVAVGLTSSVSDDQRGIGPGLGLAIVVASLAGAALLMGFLDGGPAQDGWTIPLVVDGTAVRWTLEASSQFDGGLSFQVTRQIGWIPWMLGLSAVCALVAAGLPALDVPKLLTGVLWLSASAAALAVMVMLLVQHGQPVELPDVAATAEVARNWLVERGVSAELAGQGGLNVEGTAKLSLSALRPHVVFSGMASLIALGRALRVLAGSEDAVPSRGEASRAHARDFTFRAVILAWLAWAIGLLISWTQLGYFGDASPAGLTMTGTLLVVSGIGLVGWTLPAGRFDEHVRSVTPAIMAALLILAIAVSLVFNTPPGLSLSF